MNWIGVQVVLLGALLGAVLGDWGPVIGSGPHPMLRVAGTAVIAVALGLAVYAIRDLGDAFRVQPAPEPEARLVDRGIYGRLRHPMYTAAVAASLGFALREARWAAAAAALAVIVFYLIKARHEERLLLAAYPEYVDYMHRTLGVLPLRPMPRRHRPPSS